MEELYREEEGQGRGVGEKEEAAEARVGPVRTGPGAEQEGRAADLRLRGHANRGRPFVRANRGKAVCEGEQGEGCV